VEIDGHELRDGISVTDIHKLTIRELKPGVERPLSAEWPSSAASCCALTLRVLPESTTNLPMNPAGKVDHWAFCTILPFRTGVALCSAEWL